MFVNLLSVRRVYQADAVVISFVLFVFLPPCPLWPTRKSTIDIQFLLCCVVKQSYGRLARKSVRLNSVLPD